jgi:hypothetical protein
MKKIIQKQKNFGFGLSLKTINLNFTYYTKRLFSMDNLNAKLKKKFYKKVDIKEIINEHYKEDKKEKDKKGKDNKKDENSSDDDKKFPGKVDIFTDLSTLKEKYYYILLDGRKCKSMYQDELAIPNKRLALAIAEEWDKQKELINLHSMQMVL